jgi:predicted dithiol-disulfide oxidoreductase (DUF899 family)
MFIEGPDGNLIVDFMWPYWNILDCTPEGRPKENTRRLQYP